MTQFNNYQSKIAKYISLRSSVISDVWNHLVQAGGGNFEIYHQETVFPDFTSFIDHVCEKNAIGCKVVIQGNEIAFIEKFGRYEWAYYNSEVSLDELIDALNEFDFRANWLRHFNTYAVHGEDALSAALESEIPPENPNWVKGRVRGAVGVDILSTERVITVVSGNKAQTSNSDNSMVAGSGNLKSSDTYGNMVSRVSQVADQDTDKE
ncbi:TPA: hypothetical protein ACGIK9_003408 [Acinetobacter baumannii]|uniref:hypothetical protein n=1 Tax=Acinetobacter baumannii TaxID=470 RepID=UPI00338DD230